MMKLVDTHMNCTAETLSLEGTGYFSRLIVDYITQHSQVGPYYEHPVSEAGLKAALGARQASEVPRETLVAVLKEQYNDLDTTAAVQNNIDLLLQKNTYTVCTAHQPALFTGNLYFIYKIAQTIALAKQLSQQYPDKNFVPVFWMGSEDADIDELGYVYLNGETIRWQPDQSGAVGRMRNKGIATLIDRVEGELSVLPHGSALIKMLRAAYQENETFQQACLRMIDMLFSEWGVVVLIPDHPLLKKEMIPVFEDDLIHQTAAGIVEETAASLNKLYRVQANPREINLFYLADGIRNLIVYEQDRYWVKQTSLSFSREEIITLLHQHPERFSPNVILRGLFQETVLPNIATIGGGGETAYWLELKALFKHYQVLFPVLILRNSFLFINHHQLTKMQQLKLKIPDLFLPLNELQNKTTLLHTTNDLSVAEELKQLNALYDRLISRAEAIDTTLINHIKALRTGAENKLASLEKKFIRSEKRNLSNLNHQAAQLKAALFPKNGLQERVENFLPFYARYGSAFIDMIVQQSPAYTDQFIVIKENQ